MDARARGWPGNTGVFSPLLLSAHTHCRHWSVRLLASPLPPLAPAPAADLLLAWEFPATTQHLLNPVSDSLFSPSLSPHSGATRASPVGISACDSAMGRVMASDSPLQQDQHPSDEKRDAQGELCCLLLCCTTLSSFFVSPEFWT